MSTDEQKPEVKPTVEGAIQKIERELGVPLSKDSKDCLAEMATMCLQQGICLGQSWLAYGARLATVITADGALNDEDNWWKRGPNP